MLSKSIVEPVFDNIFFLIIFANGIINIEHPPPIPNDNAAAVLNGVSSNPRPFAPLYIIKKELSVIVNPINMGNKYVVLLKLFLLLRIVSLIIP